MPWTPIAYTPRGIPLTDRDAPVEFSTAYNAQSAALDTGLDELEQAARDAQHAPTVADLHDGTTPGQENWIGKLTWVDEDGTLRLCSTLPNGWITVYREAVDGTIAFHPGWSADPSLDLTRDANEVTLNFNGDKSSAIVSKEIVGFMPVGFRPAALTYYPATVYGVGDPISATVSITQTGEIKVWFGGTTTERELSFLATFRI